MKAGYHKEVIIRRQFKTEEGVVLDVEFDLERARVIFRTPDRAHGYTLDRFALEELVNDFRMAEKQGTHKRAGVE